MNDRVRIYFKLEQDEDGYPPISVETIWAARDLGGLGHVLDNVPFFVRQATLGDLVSAREEEGVLWFGSVLVSSGNSLVRAVLFEPERRQEIRASLVNLGCHTEWDLPHQIIAISVPPSTPLRAVEAYLAEKAAAGWLDYEEPLLRQ